METRNNLYPIFLKVASLNVLIVGGGKVGLEKLSFLLKSSPDAKVEVIAKEVCFEIEELAKVHGITITKRAFQKHDIEGRHIIVAATNVYSTNVAIHQLAKKKRILINVADTPHLCDFYLGGIVTKGDLKVAISTNGKSPTMAKRFRQLLEQTLPESTGDLLNNMNVYRQTLKGDFEQKVEHLNTLTESFISKN